MTLGALLTIIFSLTTTIAVSCYLWFEKRRYRTLAKQFQEQSEEEDKFQFEIDEEFDRLRRAERELRENEAFSESLFQATKAGLMIINPDTRQIMDINTSGAAVLGGSVDQIIGENALNFGLCPDPDSSDCGHNNNQQIEFTRLDGTKVAVLHSITPMWGQTSNMEVSSFLDISELKEKEIELQEFNDRLAKMMDVVKKSKEHVAQSEKLASIGQLAAGVAHEINNPVGFVTSNLGTIDDYVAIMKNLLQRYEKMDSLDNTNTTERQALMSEINTIKEEEDLDFIMGDLENVLEESLDGVNRVSEIVQNLKSFARTDNPTLVAHDINEGLESMIKMVWNELKYHCTIEKDLLELPLIQCHPGQINQVLMNMLVNASQAMGDEEGIIKVSTALSGEGILIKIADNGTGIPEEVLNRIFDPFFTTKEVGKGTGLGLSISHGIIKDHGGRIEVSSVVGKGTEFQIYLPLTQDPSLSPETILNQNPESELIG